MLFGLRSLRNLFNAKQIVYQVVQQQNSKPFRAKPKLRIFFTLLIGCVVVRAKLPAISFDKIAHKLRSRAEDHIDSLSCLISSAQIFGPNAQHLS